MKDPGVSAESHADSMRALIECEPAVAMMLHDYGHYLVDDILVKVDRASMRESLELRNPFLDPAVVEFSWRLPQAMKFRNGKGKYLPRQLLNRYVPEHLTDRPKQGFAAPVKSWLQGALTDWADELLSPANLNRQGIFNTDAVDALWQQRKADPGKGHSKLWTLLMFQVWHEAWM
jgi:asparagine synthase (glutamine-hydrolysing)